MELAPDLAAAKSRGWAWTSRMTTVHPGVLVAYWQCVSFVPKRRWNTSSHAAQFLAAA